MPEHQDLRERLVAAQLASHEELTPEGVTFVWTHTNEQAADRALAALAADPGDLPKRMADAIRQAAHDCDDDCEVVGCHPNIAAKYTSAGGTIIEVEGTPEALAEAVMPVRDGATAHVVARLAEAEAEVERLRAELAALKDTARKVFDPYGGVIFAMPTADGWKPVLDADKARAALVGDQ